jgi:hypothetical protein
MRFGDPRERLSFVRKPDRRLIDGDARAERISRGKARICASRRRDEQRRGGALTGLRGDGDRSVGQVRDCYRRRCARKRLQSTMNAIGARARGCSPASPVRTAVGPPGFSRSALVPEIPSR